MSELSPGELEWRKAMLGDLSSDDIGRSTRALLALTYDDPDRIWLEALLLRTVDDQTADPQLRTLSVVCMGHSGRMRGKVGKGVVTRLRELLKDPEFGDYAENALGDFEDIADVV